MLAVVQENERNKVDQDLLFEEIKKQSNIEIVRVLLKDLDSSTKID